MGRKRGEGRAQCSVEGCSRFVIGRGWCNVHYYRWWRNGDPLVDLRSASYRLENYVDKSGPPHPVLGTPCWVWTGYSFGVYGGIKVNDELKLVHRYAWEVNCGEIPVGLCVLHHCDNPPCINTEHLFLGTLGDNSADRDAKLRQAYGVKNGRAILTEAQVVEIREIYAEGKLGYGKIASKFGIDKTQVARIVKRIHWSRVA